MLRVAQRSVIQHTGLMLNLDLRHSWHRLGALQVVIEPGKNLHEIHTPKPMRKEPLDVLCHVLMRTRVLSITHALFLRCPRRILLALDELMHI